MPIFLVVALGYASPENADDFKTGSGIISAVVKQVTGQTYDQALGLRMPFFWLSLQIAHHQKNAAGFKPGLGIVRVVVPRASEQIRSTAGDRGCKFSGLCPRVHITKTC